MKYEQFISTVADRAGVTTDEATAISRATLETLAERLTAGEAKDLAAQLPADMQRWLIPPTPEAQKLSVQDFVQRVADRAQVDEQRARQGISAVFNTLRDAVTEGEFDDVLAQLPREFAEVVQVPPR
jgi:uncharacterized protein (DUF2267 family)